MHCHLDAQGLGLRVQDRKAVGMIVGRLMRDQNVSPQIRQPVDLLGIDTRPVPARRAAAPALLPGCLPGMFGTRAKCGPVGPRRGRVGLPYGFTKNVPHPGNANAARQRRDASMQASLFEANDAITDEAEARRNPFLSQTDMRAVLTRSLRLYLEGHAGRVPRRLVIHKTTAFTEGELQGVQDVTQSIPEVECVEIGSSSAWRGVWMVEAPAKQPSIQPAWFPVPRGTMVMTSGKLCPALARRQCAVGCRGKGLLPGWQEHSRAHCPSSAYGTWPLRSAGIRSHGAGQDGLEQRRPV